MVELRDALREATNKIGVIAGSPQLIVFDAMLTSYPTITIAGPIGFGVNSANAFAGAAATIEVIANGANVPTFAGITASGSWANAANSVNRIDFECLPSGSGSALAFYAKISQPTGSNANAVTSVAGKTGAVTLVKGDVGLGAVDNTADADKPISGAVSAELAGKQAADPTLQSIATTVGTGLIRRNANETVTLLPTGAMGEQLLATGDGAAVQSAIQIGTVLPEIYIDNYTKKTISIKAGGLKTDERWLFIPIFYDNYTRVVVSRGYNDDSGGYGALSAVLEVSTGVWGSSGTGAFARIQKINEYAWPGAFVGATAHLLREVRLLESSGAEVAYSGLWLKVMGDRTYKISGCNGTPVDYETYVPTIGTPLAILTPPGMGTITRIKGNYYFASNGEEIDPVLLAPNGSRWRVSVSNTGVISTTAI